VRVAISLTLMGALVAAFLILAACSTTHDMPTIVSGNGQCHPSQDLPAKKTMNKVPEQDTAAEDLWGLFLQERKDHAADQRDYNSLYDQCVANVPTAPGPAPAAPLPDAPKAKSSWLPSWL